MYDAITSVKALYDLVTCITCGQVIDKLIYAYWKQLWHIIKTNALNSTRTQKKLVRDSLHQLAVDTQADSSFIMAEIKRHNIRLTPALRSALVEYASGFAIAAG